MVAPPASGPFLSDEFPGIFSDAPDLREDHLADLDPGMDGKGVRTDVHHLQDHLSVEARVDKAGRDMDLEADSGEAAPPFQPAAHALGQPDPLLSDADRRLPRQQDERAVHLDQLADGRVIGLLGHIEGPPQGGLKDPELVSDVEIDGPGTDVRL